MLKDVKVKQLYKCKKINYSYFPIFVSDYYLSRDELYNKLKKNGIYGRRYFYPLITDFHMYKNLKLPNLAIAENIASKVICLPIYELMNTESIKFISEIIKEE